MHSFRPVIVVLTALVVALSACSVTSLPESTTTTSMAPGSPASDLTLVATGLGPFVFGDSSEVVINGVTDTVGGWDVDSSDNDAIAPPACDQGGSRVVTWGSLVLTFAGADGTDVFTGWAYGFDPITGNTDDNRSLELTTPEGIGLGSARSDLVGAYGANVLIVDDSVLDMASFVVGPIGPTQIIGTLDKAGAAGSVNFLQTSPIC